MSESDPAEDANPSPPLVPAANGSPLLDPEIQDVVLGPGNVKHLKFWNFLFFSYGEYKLDHYVNMIVAPEEEGTSTATAALCLCLGGTAKLLGFKFLTSLIKRGQIQSKIQATVVNLLGHDMVIQRSFSITEPKSLWEVNGIPSNIGHVRELASQLRIQFDNTCQFLPFERFPYFAHVSPLILFREMERAIGNGTLFKKHQGLMELEETIEKLSKQRLLLQNKVRNTKANMEKLELKMRKAQRFEEIKLEIKSLRRLIAHTKLEHLRQREALRQLEPEKLVEKLETDSQMTEELLEKMQHRISEQVTISDAKVRQGFVSRSNSAGGDTSVLDQSNLEGLNPTTSISSEEPSLTDKGLFDRVLWIVAQTERLEHFHRDSNTKHEGYDRAEFVKEFMNHDFTSGKKTTMTDFANSLRERGKLKESYIMQKFASLEVYLSKMMSLDQNCSLNFEEQKADFAFHTMALSSLENKLEMCEAQKFQLFENWKQAIFTSLGKLRKNFQKVLVNDNIAHEGKVVVVESKRIEDWELEVFVKFQGEDEFKSHQEVKSVHEQALLTASLLVAFHGVTNSPIRVIDFFNRGMEPDSESRILEFLADLTLKSRSTQYLFSTRGTVLSFNHHPKITLQVPISQSAKYLNREYLIK